MPRFRSDPNDGLRLYAHYPLELIYDPVKHSCELWERNATSDNFVADGRFKGQFKPDALFLNGVWASDSGGESGRLTLRKGADAPCTMAADV